MLMVKNHMLWTVYIITQSSTVVVYGGIEDSYHTQWFMNPDFLPPHSITLEPPALRFEQLEGQIFWLKGEAVDHADRVEFRAEEQPVAFGFSNNKFRFASSGEEPWVLSFADASGSFTIDLKSLPEIP